MHKQNFWRDATAKDYDTKVMEKITSKKTAEGIQIEISAAIPKGKLQLLRIWFLLWTACGMIVFAQFFTPVSKETKMMMAIWFVFWIYFEYKVTVIYAWRKNGKELLEINKNKISLQRSISGKEKKQGYELENISALQVEDHGNLAKSMGSSFWVQGAETLSFKYLGRKVGFGLQLSEQEAKSLYKMLKPYFK